MIKDVSRINQKVTLMFSTNRYFGNVSYMVMLIIRISASTFDDSTQCSVTKIFESKDEFVKFAVESVSYFDNFNESYVEYDYLVNSKNEWIGYRSIEVYNDDFEFTDPDSILAYDEQ